MKFQFGDIIKNTNLRGTVVCVENSDNNVERYVICCDKPTTRLKYEYLKNASGAKTKLEKERFAFYNLSIEPCCFVQYCHTITSEQPDYKLFKKIGEKPFVARKFKIGDKVMTNKTGPINTGKVIGYTDMHKYLHTPYGLWSQLYPDCINKPVYFIHLDTPNKSCTFDEYVAQRKLEINRAYAALPKPLSEILDEQLGIQTSIMTEVAEYWKESYQQISNVVSIAAPEDDLSIVDIGKMFDNLIG